jgi:hypothetical protein
VDVVGGSGKGQVNQGEYGSAHYTALGVAVALGDGQAANGAARGDFIERDAVLQREAVALKVGACLVDVFKYGHFRSSCFFTLYVNNAKMQYGNTAQYGSNAATLEFFDLNLGSLATWVKARILWMLALPCGVFIASCILQIPWLSSEACQPAFA